MTDIVRVWGTCDEKQIEFKYEGGEMWLCRIPPDLKDGIYVAEFWAQDEKGRIGHWSGFLYMFNGICHFKFNQEKYQIWLHPNKYKFEFKKEDSRGTYFLEIQPICFSFEIEQKKYEIGFEVKAYETCFFVSDFSFDYKETKFDFDFENNYEYLFLLENKYEFNIDDNYEIFFEKRCEHWEP